MTFIQYQEKGQKIILEFPTPSEDGAYLYQANVWYKKNDRWFFDGIAAAYNFTIQVGDEYIPHIEEYVSIIELSTPESLNVSSIMNLNIILQYSYINLTEISVNVQNTDLEIIAEEFDSVVGMGTREYNLSFNSPSEAGLYLYTVNVGSETTNSSISTSQEFSLETIAPIVEPPPSRGNSVYIIVPVILVLAFVIYKYRIKKD